MAVRLIREAIPKDEMHSIITKELPTIRKELDFKFNLKRELKKLKQVLGDSIEISTNDISDTIYELFKEFERRNSDSILKCQRTSRILIIRLSVLIYPQR